MAENEQSKDQKSAPEGEAAGQKDAAEESANLVTVQIAESEVAEAKGISDMPVRVIKPGWGSAGYYSPKVLQEAVAAGEFNNRHMYWDHRSVNERRERSLRNFVGATHPTGATYEENGPKGPGVYARAEVIPAYKESVEAMAEHIGLSIVGAGEARYGTEEGRRGPVFQNLAIESIDYVTHPGAGGAIIEEFKRRGSHNGMSEESKPMPKTKTQESDPQGAGMDAKALAAMITEAVSTQLEESGLTKLTESLKTLGEAQTRNEHLRVAESAVRAADVPAPMQERIMEAVAADHRMIEENADPAAIATEVMEREMRYAKSLNPALGMLYQSGQTTVEEAGKAILENMDDIFGEMPPEDEE